MTNHRVLLDSFADARRTWDELVGLQPDIKAGSGNLQEDDLVELERRINAHRMAIDTLADAVEAEPSDAAIAASSTQPTGISNRESARDEAYERQQHPRLVPDSPPSEDAGRVGEQQLDDMRNGHTSHKAGSRSVAQKEAESRYPDRSMPPSRKVAGAFGKEPK